MSSKKPFDKARTLIKAFKATAASDFRRQYEELLTDADTGKQLNSDEVQALKAVSAAMQRWHAEAATGTATALEEWLALHQALKATLPRPVLEAVLGLVPPSAAKEVDWRRVVLQGDNLPVLRMLVKHKLLRHGDLAAVAKADPNAFYHSAALDVLLELEKCAPRPVWDTLTLEAARPEGLLQGAEALAESYSLDQAGNASTWLVQFLADKDDIRRSVLIQLLRDRPALEKLVKYLSEAATVAGKRNESVKGATESVVTSLVELCAEAIESGKRTSPDAAWAAGMLVLAADSPKARWSAATSEAIAEHASRIARRQVVEILRTADDALEVKGPPVVVMPSDLYHGVMEFLEGLPSGEGETTQSTRASIYQRHQGRREVIQELLPLLRAVDEGPVLRHALDAALFNVGLRPVGLSGGPASFDSRKHAPASSGILPGDEVTILDAGWQLGDGEDALVVEKARVDIAN